MEFAISIHKNKTMKAHEIDYHIHGEEMQFVEIELDPYETVIAEPSAFMMMEDGIEMKTIFGDGSGQGDGGGIWGKVWSAGKRLLTGEGLFMTAFTHVGEGKRRVSFASPYPGRIVGVDLSEYEGKIICQKDTFLCAAQGVSVGIEFSQKLGRGFFGGEGFIMQKLEGDGMAFMHAGGAIVEKELQIGEVLRIDTGCLVGFTRYIDYDIEMIKGVKNVLFGGEGLFYARLEGPGKVWIQSLPFSRLADRVMAASRRYGQGGKGEGSILGGLGNVLDGDGW
jgi:uncharacterized protein (TIGR00266 family)